jgi:hypothetical protein
VPFGVEGKLGVACQVESKFGVVGLCRIVSECVHLG